MSAIGTVFEIREFSLFDGPGIRTTVFLKGCPLRCVWCHNPEGIRPESELLATRSLCRNCGRCAAVCPKRSTDAAESIEPSASKSVFWGAIPPDCSACGRCVPVCFERVRRICGERIDAATLAKRLARGRDLFESEGGGVTFSGGEPLSQADFVVECAERLRESGVETAVETCGWASEADYRRVVGAVDFVLQDLKHPDSEAHRRWTGRGNEPILRNLRVLKASGKPFVVRIPAIPTVNDAPETLEAFAALLTDAPTLRRVELLPFHSAGRSKRSLLRDDPTARTPENVDFWRRVETGEIDRARRLSEESLKPFRERGIPCRID